MLQVRQQIKKEINLKSYDNRILITGLDSCISKDDFILELVSYINTLNEDIIFLSLNEREGPERWIIQWCKENDWLKIEGIEVIGNIHDNKELLK